MPRAAKRPEIRRDATGAPLMECDPGVHLYMHGSPVCQCGAEHQNEIGPVCAGSSDACTGIGRYFISPDYGWICDACQDDGATNDE